LVEDVFQIRWSFPNLDKFGWFLSNEKETLGIFPKTTSSMFKATGMWVCAKIINHPKWLIMKCHWVLHVLGPLGTPSMTHNHQNQSIWGQNFHHFTIYLRAAWGKNKDPESYSNIVRPSLAIWGSHLHVSQIEIIKKNNVVRCLFQLPTPRNSTGLKFHLVYLVYPGLLLGLPHVRPQKIRD
jgi:hypothetical protein